MLLAIRVTSDGRASRQGHSFQEPSSCALEPCDPGRQLEHQSRTAATRNLDFLSKTSADLILLQEADVNARRTQYRNIAREIAQALRMNYVFGREFEELTQSNHSSPAYHGQATLSKLPILSSRILTFGRQSGFWRPRWFIPQLETSQRRLGGRMALVSHVAWSEKRLLVYNLHLESRGSDRLRSSQLAEVVRTFTDVARICRWS